MVRDTYQTSSEPIVNAAFVLVFDASGRILFVRENYDRKRYGFPGGRVEPGESPAAAAVRVAWEEACIKVHISYLQAIYRFRGAANFVSYVFSAVIIDGAPSLPDTDEIAEIGWFHPNKLPTPLTETALYAIPSAKLGEREIDKEVFL